MISKENMKNTFLWLFTFQLMLLVWFGMNSPFVAGNFTSALAIQAAIISGVFFYLSGWKQLKIAYKEKKAKAIQRIKFKREVEAQVANQMGLGYDKIKRS